MSCVSPTTRVVMIANLLITSGEIMSSWPSPILPKLKSNDTSINPIGSPITDDEGSWIAALFYTGAIFGPFPCGLLATRLGRRRTLLVIAIPYMIAYLILAFARETYLFYLARFLAGMAVGSSYTILPVYIAEISQDSNRGMFLLVWNMYISFGNLVPYIIGPYVSIMAFNLILLCVPVTFFCLFFFLAPETPYYLLKQDRKDEAMKSLARLRSGDKEAIEDEIKHMRDVLAKDEKQGTIMDLFRSKSNLKGLAIALSCVFVYHFSGFVAIFNYTQDIFDSAGGGNIPSDVSAIIVGLVFFATSFTAPFLTDRVGRRLLQMVSCVGMAVAQMAFGIYYNLQKNNTASMDSLSWLPVTSMTFYIMTVNINVTWSIAAELFPTSVKSIASGLVALSSGGLAVLVSKYFNTFNEVLDKDGTFFLFSSVCLAGFLIAFFFVPETKGKNFKEIQEILERSPVVSCGNCCR